MAITKLLLNGVEYDIGNIYNIVTEGPQLYDGRELSEYTWAQLKQKCQNADYGDLRIGDYKTITLADGEVVKMQIAGIDTYYRGLDGIGHHIDFVTKNCLFREKIPWAKEGVENNNGNSTEQFPYYLTYLYEYLNITIYNDLPSDLKAVISNKRSLLERRYSASGILSNGNGRNIKDIGKLWPLSEYEVTSNYLLSTNSVYARGAAEVQYPLFANSIIHIVKNTQEGQGIRSHWWLINPGSDSTAAACTISDQGLAGRNPLQADYCRVVFGLRLLNY